MSINVRIFKVLSSDGIHNLAGVVYEPECEAKGYFHIVHGMTEHIGRYDRFMRDMAEQGYICFGYDHLGHGYTANDDSELGYIADKDGWDYLCRDVKVFSDAVMSEYGDDKPYILMGHSMGSFVVRVATEKYVKPDRLIVMGTSGPNPAADAGLALISVIKLFKGDKHFSKFIDNLSFGSYNDHFGGGSESDPKPWLTNDVSILEKYYADRFCTFNFSVSAMGDLIRLIKECNRADWYKGISQSMPVLLVSGADDPVGNYGKGVQTVCEGLKEQGIDTKCIIYPEARHEILNDFTYDQVKEDIIAFIN